jgi:hypothetical protein
MALQPSVSFSNGAEAVSAVRGDAVINSAIIETIETVNFDFRIKLNLFSSESMGIAALHRSYKSYFELFEPLNLERLF